MSAFLLTSGTGQGCLLSPVLFNVVLQALVRKIREEERHPDWQRSKTIFTDDMLWYIECYSKFTKKKNPKQPVDQSCRMQDKYIKINGVSIHLNDMQINSAYISIKQ